MKDNSLNEIEESLRQEGIELTELEKKYIEDNINGKISNRKLKELLSK